MRFVLITPSYGPDFERCRLLCESVRRFAPPDLRHHVIVDKRDEALFKSLASDVVRIHTVESVLPWWIFRLPCAQRWWMSLKTPPIRNWLLQQLVKLSMADVVDADVLMFVDSDVTFVRPFDTSRFLQGGQVRLSRVDYQSESHARWLDTSRQLLKLGDIPMPQVNYVGNLITWRRDDLLKLHDYLRQTHGTGWIQAICRHWHFSEYMLYGAFVEHVLGYEQAGHYPSDQPVLKLSWGHKLDSEPNVAAFLQELHPEHIGIMIHSKDAIPIARYRPHIERLWEQKQTV